MEFGKHIGKGLWAFADKALPAIYGLGFVFLVVRVLPEEEYGAFVIIQTVFTFVSALGYSLSFQPLVKFAAETDDNGQYIVASLTMCMIFFTVASVLLYVLKDVFVPLLDATGRGKLMLLMNYVPLLLFAALYRSFAISLLQSKYQVQKIFWIDAVYFLGILLLIYLAGVVHRFSNAQDLIMLNLIAQIGSSVLALVVTYKLLNFKVALQPDAFRKMWDFGKYSFGGVSLYTVYAQMDVFFVSSFRGVGGVAIYSAAKIFTRIFDMLAQVIQMFLIPFSSKSYVDNDKEKLRITAEKSICFSTLVLLPVFIAMFFFPRELLHLLYKGKYDDGFEIVRVLSFVALIMPWNAVVVSYMGGFGKVKEGLLFSIALIVITVPTFLMLTPRLGALGTAIGLVSTFLVITILLVRYFRQFVPLKILNVIKYTADVWIFVRTKIFFPAR